MISQLEEGYLLALHQVKGIGNLALQAIHDRNLSFQQVWEDPGLLLKHKILDQSGIDMLLFSRKYLSPVGCMEELQKENCGCLTRWSSGYPQMLEDLYDAPAVLYYQGSLDLLIRPMAAVVGARTASVYGKKVAAMLGQQLGEAGITVVSGLARGIDSAAHRGALPTEGSTIGVLGNGVNVVYPRENQQLYQAIAANGLLLSEFPLGIRPNASNFPRRNRIIAALSRAVVVVEAAERSGALITVDHALELGREVWAVPGPITSPQSQGTNQLIRDGALLALEAGDIVSSLCPGQKVSPADGPTLCLTLEEGRIMEMIGEYPVHLDEVAAALDFPRGELTSLLLKLELKGIITCLAGNHYVRK